MKKLVCLLGLLLLVGTAAQAQNAENVAPAGSFGYIKFGVVF